MNYARTEIMGDTVRDIIKNNLCFGCGTCSVVCQKTAITLSFNSIGQLLPSINADVCVDCGLCYNYCPSLDVKGNVGHLLQNNDIYGNILNVSIGRSTNDLIYKNSQSGGVATGILYYLFESGLIDAAIVCQTVYSDDYLSKAIIVTNKNDLLTCQKSSYTPVDMVSALKSVSCYEKVAFIGTGCHIQGVRTLKTIRKRKFSNIKYLIGLVCDRTLCKTSTDILYGNNAKGRKKKLIWRDKTNDYKHAKLIVEEENGKRVEIPSWKRHYLKQYFTSPRCLICFDKLNLGADVVLGDPWGINGVDWKNGDSLVICRTIQGQSILKAMLANKMIQLRIVDTNKALKGQDIDNRLKSIRRYLHVFEDQGWLVPRYSEKIMSDTPINAIEHEQNVINRFLNDKKTEKHKLIRKYSRQLRLFSLKRRIYTLYSLIKH